MSLLVVLAMVAGGAPADALTLEDATEVALEHASEMVLAREDLVLVDAQYMQALSAVLPRVDVSFSARELFAGSRILESRNPRPAILPTEFPQVVFGPFRDAQTNNYSNPDVSLSITGRQLIYDGGRWWTVLERVEDVRDQQKSALKGVQNEVRAAVARTFYGLEKSRRAIGTLEEQLALDQTQVDRARALFDSGRGEKADIATARRNLIADEVSMQDFLRTEAQARRTFNLQLGRAPSTKVLLSIDPAVDESSGELPNRPLPPAAELMDLARTNRPELASLRALLRVRQKDADIAGADYWPTVELETRYQRGSRRPDRVFNNPFENYTATANLAVTWNLFSGFATDAAVETAMVAVRRQSEEVERQEREVLAEVEDRHEEVERQRAVYALAQRQIRAAEEALTLASGRFTAGRGTALELRDAELGITQAKLTAINARLDLEIAFAELVRAVGSGELR